MSAKQKAETVARQAQADGLDVQMGVTVPSPGTVAPYFGCRIRELTLETSASEWPTSLDRTEPHQCAAIFNAGNPPDYRVEVGQSVKFVAHHWLMYLDEFRDEESGELKPGPVLVLYDRDGKTLKSTSQFAPRRLKAALELYTPADWQRGITFCIWDRPSRMPGRHYHDIRIVVDQ